MDVITENVLRGFSSLALEEFKLLWDIKDDTKRMEETVSSIKAALLDAEAEAKTHQLRLWLERLKDVLYDADDLLDDLSTEALTREMMTRNKMAKKLRVFFSKSNQVVYNLKIGHQMREIRKRLDEIYDDRKKLQRNDPHPRKIPTVYEERKQTDSIVQQDEIIGREEEKKVIFHYLFETNEEKEKESSVSIIPIVGIGGLGKTALAQLVYNHEAVQKHFDLKIWVCVSGEFNARQIAEKILGQKTTKETEQVLKELREYIKEKRFLIVLDDVWNEDAEQWRKLKEIMKEGKGSKIIVTTRSEKVGKIMRTYPPVSLTCLDEERSWKLFCQMAFEEGKEPKNKQSEEIGRDIVKKCAGVPLAIRTIGSLLYSRNLEEIDWSYFRDSEVLHIDEEENKILAILKLSYDHLPSPLKNCFAYCSLFPKGFQFEKQTLIQLWVAEGFIQPSNPIRSQEDVGHEYFMNLLSRSFFLDVRRDRYGDVKTFKMHDLIHDLARSMAGNEYVFIGKRKEGSICCPTRHLSCYFPEYAREVPKVEKLRTMLPLIFSKGIIYNPKHTQSVIGLFTTNLKVLRVLVLRGSSVRKIPRSMGSLKHLRFLDLSYTGISHLPWDLTRLHNLQTLKLSDTFVRELPRDIDKLESLRHLELDNCSFNWMPHGLGQLTSLQTLTTFVVDEQNHHGRSRSAGISELGGLNKLRGCLVITGLNHLRANTKEAKSAKLQEKGSLKVLELVWCGKWSNSTPLEDESSSEVASKDELILEELQPHHGIKGLVIRSFCGKKLPDWIGNLSSLLNLEIRYCKYLTSLPEGLRKLRSLKRLVICECPRLEEGGDDWQKIAHIPSVIHARSKLGLYHQLQVKGRYEIANI